MPTDLPPHASLAPAAEPLAASPGADRYKARPWAFVLLLAGVLCMGMGQSVVFAVLPPIARDIGLADFQVLVIFMLSATFWVLMSPFWGRLSDGRGRRPFLLLGIGGFVVSMVLFAWTIHLGMTGALSGLGFYVLILCMRGTYGIIGSAQPPAAQAYIADRTTPENRAKGLAGFAAAFGLGAMLGPAFAGVAVLFGPLAPLYGVAGLGVIAGLAIFFFLPENNPPRERKRKPQVKLNDARVKPFLIYALISGAITAIPIQMIGFYFIDILSLTSEEAFAKVSVALTASAMAALFAQLVLVQKFSLPPKILMRTGPVLLIIGHSLIALGLNYPMLIIAMLFAGLGGGLVLPGYTAAASLAVTPEEQGATSGLTNSAGASGFILAPIFGSALYMADPRGPFLLTMLAAIALAVFAWRSKHIAKLSD